MKIPNYCALCIDDDEFVTLCGRGETPDEAFDDFMSNGDFESHCDSLYLKLGVDLVDIYIYTVIDVDESPWPEDERHPDWEWCLDRKIETRKVKAQ